MEFLEGRSDKNGTYDGYKNLSFKRYHPEGVEYFPTLNIPLSITPGRNTFAPALSLSYNSGGGNSVFGLGWSADPLSISRKTDNRIPTYTYSDGKDVFLFSGAEDLVPLLKETNTGWEKDKFKFEGYNVTRYRPRIEGIYARIEKSCRSTF